MHRPRPSASSTFVQKIDIDLSILGASPQRFDEYETAIREEYSWVPRVVFDIKRRSILNEFRRRRTLFRTAYFANRFEQQARDNIDRSLALRAKRQ